MTFFHTSTLEIIETDDGVNEATDIRAGCDGPLETIAVEHLGGVIVVGTLRRPVHVDDLDVVAKFVKHMFEVSLGSIIILFAK